MDYRIQRYLNFQLTVAFILVNMEAIQPSFHWNWTNLCPTGLTPWIPHANYLTPCFQEICLQLPILLLFAIVSSYHFGRQALLVARNKTQIYLIYQRIIVAFILGFVPIFEMYDMVTRHIQIWPIDILINCAKSVTWIVHLGKYCGFMDLNHIKMHLFFRFVIRLPSSIT